MIVDIDRFRELSRRTQAGIAAAFLGVLTAMPVLLPGSVLAAPTLAERELATSTARPAQSTNLVWTFDTTADVANITFIQIEFCDSPLGACATASGDSDNGATDHIPQLPGSPTATIGGSGAWAAPANSASRVVGYNGGGSAGDNNQIDIDVTTPFAGASADESTITINGFTNDDQANVSYYTRMRFYNNDAHAPGNLVWEGVFAQSTSQTLTVNARVQERLDFCVGADDLDDATSRTNADDALANNCADITGSAVDIGNVENSFTNVSPVTAANGGDAENGIAMVRTNAFNGVVVDYKSLQDTSSGTLKVPGAACGDLTPVTGVATDRCFNSSTTQGAFTAGVEQFGMTIAGVNCGSTAAYTCNFAGGTYNLIRDAAYDGTGGNTYLADADQESGTTAGGYAWENTTAADRIAGSSTVVDDEALILKFAATAGVTTPTGAYTVQADFIATATF